MKSTIAILAASFTLVRPEAFTQPAPGRPETVQLRSIGRMNVERFAHTSTLLPDGRVLIAGGQNSVALASAELFNPASNTFTPTPTMSVARSSHTATLLPDGTVLLAGGYNGSYLATAEIYNPATGNFTPVSSMSVARSGHEAILLNNGKVLLAGGVGTGWTFLSSAEIYDPETSMFTPTGSMTTARESHTMTLLNNGRVLVTGGHKGRRAAVTIYASAELYDPSTGSFSPTGNMTLRRHKHDATLLRDGSVLIVGGADEQDRDGAYTSMEKYSPDTGRFSPVGNTTVRRYKHRGTTIVLPTARVLIAGGATTAEVYDPSVNATVRVAGSYGSDRLFSTATVLRDGRVLITGGYNQNMATSSGAWIVE